MSTANPIPALLCVLVFQACAPEPPSIVEHVAHARVDPVSGSAEGSADGGAADARVVAEFSGGKLTIADVRRWTDSWSEYDRMRYQSPDRKRELVQEIVALELLAGEAIRAGYDQRPEVLAMLKREVARRYLDDRAAGSVSLKDIPDAEVQAFYEGHRADYVTPETRRVRHLVVGREALARQVRAELDAELVAAAHDAGVRVFEAFVTKYSEDRDTRGAYGDLGWVDASGRVRGTVRDSSVCADLAAAAFAVPDGWGPVGPVACGASWVVGLVVEVRPQRQQPFDEVSSRVRNQLLQERREASKRALIDQLREQAGVRIDEAALKALEAPGRAEPSRLRLPSVRRLGTNPATLPMLRPAVHAKVKDLDEATKRALIEEQAGKVHR